MAHDGFWKVVGVGVDRPCGHSFAVDCECSPTNGYGSTTTGFAFAMFGRPGTTSDMAAFAPNPFDES